MTIKERNKADNKYIIERAKKLKTEKLAKEGKKDGTNNKRTNK